MTNKPKVFVILLNWNNYLDTIETIRSVRQCTYSGAQLLVVDNGSTNESEQVLRNELAVGEFIQSGSNLGFSGGCNVGIREALQRGADYVLLLNNDTVAAPDFLDNLVAAAEEHQEAGLLTGKTYNYYRKKELCSAGAFIHPVKGTAAIHRGEGKNDIGRFDRPRHVGFAPGYCLFIRGALLRDIGLLDERFFLGAEEFEFSMRASRAGYKIYYEPRAVIWHKVSASHRKYDPKYIYNGYRNKIIFMNEYLPRFVYKFWAIAFWLYAFTWAPSKLTRWASKWGETLDRGHARFAILAAFRDRKKARVLLAELQAVDRSCGLEDSYDGHGEP